MLGLSGISGENVCQNCGARGCRTVCEYCGAGLGRQEDQRAERDALEAFQAILMQASAEKQAQLLRSGYLPSSGELLIEAGLRILPLLRSAGDGVPQAQADSAQARLTTIMLRLKHAGRAASDPRVVELHRALEASRRAARHDFVLGLIIISAGLALLGGLIYWLLRR